MSTLWFALLLYSFFPIILSSVTTIRRFLTCSHFLLTNKCVTLVLLVVIIWLRQSCILLHLFSFDWSMAILILIHIKVLLMCGFWHSSPTFCICVPKLIAFRAPRGNPLILDMLRYKFLIFIRVEKFLLEALIDVHFYQHSRIPHSIYV